MTTYSKTKTSYYRRLLVAYLIDTGVSTVPAIMDATGMPRRTAQDTIKALAELDIEVEFTGPNKTGCYRVCDWGSVNKHWIESHIEHVKAVLNCD